MVTLQSALTIEFQCLISISSIRPATVRTETGSCAIFLAFDSAKTLRQISVHAMIRPGNELLTDLHRAQGRNDGEAQFPWAPDKYGVTEKSQQFHKYFFNTVTLLPKGLRFEYGGTGGAKLASCPGRSLTSLRH